MGTAASKKASGALATAANSPSKTQSKFAISADDPRVPTVKLPERRNGQWKDVPFLPENFLEPEVWDELLTDAASYNVNAQQLNALFIRLCSPDDISLGTVPLRSFFKEFDPRYRRLLQRLILARSDGHSRMLFEDVARFLLQFCALDFHDLVLTALAALRDFPCMNVVSVRAVVRYLYAQGAEKGGDGMDEFTRSLCAHLHTDPDTPFHTPAAFVQLAVRYPVLVYPMILMQRSLHRRYFGISHWRSFQEAVGSALLPTSFSKADSQRTTARVLLLEAISTGAIPFRFGAMKTATQPPAELLESKMERVMREREEEGLEVEAQAAYLAAEDEEIGRQLDRNEAEERWEGRRRVSPTPASAAAAVAEGQADSEVQGGVAEQGVAEGALAEGTTGTAEEGGNPSNKGRPRRSVVLAELNDPSAPEHRRGSVDEQLIAAITSERARLENEWVSGKDEDWGDMADLRRLRAQADAVAAERARERNLREAMKGRRASAVHGGFGVNVGKAHDTGAGRRASLAAGVLPYGYALTLEDKAQLDGEAPVVNPFDYAAEGEEGAGNRGETSPAPAPAAAASAVGLVPAGAGGEGDAARRSSVYTYDYKPYFQEGETDLPAMPGIGAPRVMHATGPGRDELGRPIAQAGTDAAREAEELFNVLKKQQKAARRASGLALDATTTTRRSSVAGGAGAGAGDLPAGSRPTTSEQVIAAVTGAGRRGSINFIIPTAAPRRGSVAATTGEGAGGPGGAGGREEVAGVRRRSMLGAGGRGGASAVPDAAGVGVGTVNGLVSASAGPKYGEGGLELSAAVGRRSSIAAVQAAERRASALRGLAGDHIMHLDSNLVGGVGDKSATDAGAASGAGRRSSILQAAIVPPSAAPAGAGAEPSKGGGGEGAAAAEGSKRRSSLPSADAVLRAASTMTSEASSIPARRGSVAAQRRASVSGAAATAATPGGASPAARTELTEAERIAQSLAQPQQGGEAVMDRNVDVMDKEGHIRFAGQGEAIEAVATSGLLGMFGIGGASGALEKLQSGASGMFGDALVSTTGFTSADTRVRAAVFGFGRTFGGVRERERLLAKVQGLVSHVLSIPIPARIPTYLKRHPHPTGASCALPSLAIAKLVLAHMASGAGAMYGLVLVPCLLCGRTIRHTSEPEEQEAQEVQGGPKGGGEEEGEGDPNNPQQAVLVDKARGSVKDLLAAKRRLARAQSAKDVAEGSQMSMEALDIYKQLSRGSSFQDMMGATRGSVEPGFQDMMGATRGSVEPGFQDMMGATRGSVEPGQEAEQQGQALGEKGSRWGQEDGVVRLPGDAVGLGVDEDVGEGEGEDPTVTLARVRAGTRNKRRAAQQGRGARKPKRKTPKMLPGLGSVEAQTTYTPDYTAHDDQYDQGGQGQDGYISSGTREVGGGEQQQEEEGAHGELPPLVPSRLRAGRVRKAYIHVSTSRKVEARGKIEEQRRRDAELDRRVKLVHMAATLEAAQTAARGGPVPSARRSFVEATVGASARDMDAHASGRHTVEETFRLEDGVEDRHVLKVQAQVSAEATGLSSMGTTGGLAAAHVFQRASADSFLASGDSRLNFTRSISTPGALVGLTFDFVTWFSAAARKRRLEARAKLRKEAEKLRLERSGVSSSPTPALSPSPSPPPPSGSSPSAEGGGQRGGKGSPSPTRTTAGSGPGRLDPPGMAHRGSGGSVKGMHFAQEQGGGKGRMPSHPPPMSRLGGRGTTAAHRARDVRKSEARNTGFCAACDTYLRRLCADLFGYKVAERLLAAATVQPDTEADVRRLTAIAVAEGQPLIMNDRHKAAEAAEMKARIEELLAAGESVPAHLLNTHATYVPLARGRDWQYPDDLWLQLWEPEEARFFYYNTSTGESTWVEPVSYVPYIDPEEVREEVAVKNLALASLAAQMRAQPPKKALGQLGYRGQQEEEEDDELLQQGRGGQVEELM